MATVMEKPSKQRTDAASSGGKIKYQSGLGNEFETEALPDTYL